MAGVGRGEAEEMAERLRVAFELFDDALDMMRLRLRRAWPDATQEAIELEIDRWIASRPGAEASRCAGVTPPLSAT